MKEQYLIDGLKKEGIRFTNLRGLVSFKIGKVSYLISSSEGVVKSIERVVYSGDQVISYEKIRSFKKLIACVNLDEELLIAESNGDTDSIDCIQETLNTAKNCIAETELATEREMKILGQQVTYCDVENIILSKSSGDWLDTHIIGGREYLCYNSVWFLVSDLVKHVEHEDGQEEYCAEAFQYEKIGPVAVNSQKSIQRPTVPDEPAAIPAVKDFKMPTEEYSISCFTNGSEMSQEIKDAYSLAEALFIGRNTIIDLFPGEGGSFEVLDKKTLWSHVVDIEAARSNAFWN